MKQVSQSAQNFTGKLPHDVLQEVGYGELDTTYLYLEAARTEDQEVTKTPMVTIQQCPPRIFDAFIDPCFGSFSNVDRSRWPLATRWRAVNEAMSPEHRQKNVPYVQRKFIADFGHFVLKVIYPEE